MENFEVLGVTVFFKKISENPLIIGSLDRNTTLKGNTRLIRFLSSHRKEGRGCRGPESFSVPSGPMTKANSRRDFRGTYLILRVSRAANWVVKRPGSGRGELSVRASGFRSIVPLTIANRKSTGTFRIFLSTLQRFDSFPVQKVSSSLRVLCFYFPQKYSRSWK